MKRLTLALQPFVYNQTIMVYEDNQLKATYLTTMSEIENTIISMCKINNIHQIDIKGEKIFAEKIKEKILNLNQFEKIDINIDLY